MFPLSARLTLGFSCVAHAYTHLAMLLYATVVLTLEDAFAMSYADLQWLAVPGFVLFGVASLPAGWLGDRWSTSGMMAVFFLGLGGALILTGFATSPRGLMIGLALAGTFASIYHPVGVAWLVKNTASRGRALGFHGVFGSLGTAGAAIAAGGLADTLGWRAAFIVPGLVGLAVGLVFLVALKRGLIVDSETDVKPSTPRGPINFWRVISLLLISTLCLGLIYQATSVALPKIFDERLAGVVGSGSLGVGAMVSLVYLMAAGATVLGGELADRLPLKWVYFAAQLLQLPVLLIGFYAHNFVLVGAAICMVSLTYAGGPAENVLFARYTPLAWRSRMFGLKFVASLGVSTLGVALVPTIYDLTGSLDALFLVMMVFAGVACLAIWLLPSERPQPAEISQPAETPATKPAE